jgi:hypothetical protein
MEIFLHPARGLRSAPLIHCSKYKGLSSTKVSSH